MKFLFPKYWMCPTALIYAQASHETGKFTSNIFKKNKNLFGMKEPKIRETTVYATQFGHAVYRSHFSSIYDYFLRQSYFKINYNKTSQYIEDTFKSGYAEDPKYREKWLSFYYSYGALRYVTYLFIPSTIILLYFVISKKSISNVFK